jgi:hypothetical protein
VSVYPTCPLLFTQKPTLRPLSWAVPAHTPPAHPVCPTFPFLCAPLSPRLSCALSIPECNVLHLRIFSDSLPTLHLLRATCLNAMAISGKKKLLCVLPFRVSYQNCVPFFYSSHACYTLYPFHPASVYCYNAC